MGPVDGAAELAADFNTAANHVAAAMSGAIADTAREINDEAAATSHSSRVAQAMSWEMRNPLHAEVGPEKGNGGWIAPFVERGTAKLPPHPSLLPAADAGEERFHKRVGDALKGLL